MGKTQTLFQSLKEQRLAIGKERAMTEALQMSLEELLDWAMNNKQGGGTLKELREKYAVFYMADWAPSHKEFLERPAAEVTFRGVDFGVVEAKLAEDLSANKTEEESMDDPGVAIKVETAESRAYHVVPMPESVGKLFNYLSNQLRRYERGEAFHPIRIESPELPDVNLNTVNEMRVYRNGLYIGSTLVVMDIEADLEDHDMRDLAQDETVGD